MAPPITILLVTMNRRDLLEIALWYLYETSTAAERDLWIWDNASTDDTADFLGTLVGWPGVRVFRSKSNLGLAESRRRMIAHVQTPYIFTLDDDVWIYTRGWAQAAARVLRADPSIGQLMIPQGFALPESSFGMTHEWLDRPFFRVPPIRPTDSISVPPNLADLLPGHVEDARKPRPALDGALDGVRVESVDGEAVLVPTAGTQLPIAVSGCVSAWRTSDVLPLVRNAGRHPVSDLREAWGFPLQQAKGRREALLLRHGMVHPSPGAPWHLGRGELHWETRCQMAAAVYNRSGEEQRAWLERARTALGWGSPLEDPAALEHGDDVVMW